ncbi:MAG: ABC transporter ATP-binding protein [Acidimicrobiales bacterium]
MACSDVSVVLGGATILDGVDLEVDQGEWLSVIGPNGAGKSTILRFVAGLVDGTGGVHVQGRPASTLRRRQRAQLIALVPQTPVVPPGITVGDYVLLGRNPHIRALGVEGPVDLAAVGDALAHLDLLSFAERVLSTLSGGERQRVFIARALAQGAPILLLDEPTTALDVGHQQQVLELIDHLRKRRDLSVVSTMHDLTLAGQYADRLQLLAGGRTVVTGQAADVLTEANLHSYYGASVRIIDHDDRPMVLPRRSPQEAVTAPANPAEPSTLRS